MSDLDPNGWQDHLAALRNANDGWAISVWKNGGWKLWRTLDAKYAESDPEWLCTLSGSLIQKDLAALSATGHPMTEWTPTVA